MALATLCRDILTKNEPIMRPLYAYSQYPRTKAAVQAFIVDHKLRANSTEEASNVAAELARLRIASEILELDWSQHGDPASLSNFESVARMLRFRALGLACARNEINTLLVAHHSDDQAETALSRIHNHYLGTGLAGIRMVTPIPECRDLYGVAQGFGGSATDYNATARSSTMAITGPGIHVGRPLLSCEKSQLIALCQNSGVNWFEDPTNADRTLTVRNTVRHLQKTEDLPIALRTIRLCSLVQKVSEKRDVEQNAATDIFNSMRVEMHPRLGMAYVELQRETMLAISAAPGIVKSYLLREMLMLVNPTATIDLDQLNLAVESVFPSKEVAEDLAAPARIMNLFQVAGVQISRIAASKSVVSPFLVLQRANPYAVERQTSAVHLWPLPPDPHHVQSDIHLWRLWDHRYWIRVRPPNSSEECNTQISVRMLDSDTLARLREELPLKARISLGRVLRYAPGDVRFTMPAIFMTQNVISADASSATEKLVVLPSVNWKASGWVHESVDSDDKSWRWDIRYKHVDLSSQHHKFVMKET